MLTAKLLNAFELFILLLISLSSYLGIVENKRWKWNKQINVWWVQIKESFCTLSDANWH